MNNGIQEREQIGQFRMQAKNFALTYSNVEQQGWIEFTCQNLAHFLQRVGASYVIVSKEMHEDGSPHFHALAQWKKKKNIQNSRFFDYGEVHPNIQRVVNERAWSEYVKKGGDFIELGTKEQGMYALCAETDRNQWIEFALSAKMPFAYMEEIWKTVHPSRSIATIEDFSGGGDMCPSIAFFRFEDFRSKVLVLEGPTGCGKTTWARCYSPKPALFITHLDMLKKEYDPSYHKSIIFDDMSFSHLPREAQLHIIEQRTPTQIHVRYGVASLPPGVPKIFTCNIYPFSRDPAIDRRIYHKTVTENEEGIRLAAPPRIQEVIEIE